MYVKHLDTHNFYDLMLSGVFLVDGKLAYGIIDPGYLDFSIKMDNGEEVLDEDGEPILEWPPVVYHLHALTPEQWDAEIERAREWWSVRSLLSELGNDWHTDPRVRKFYDEWTPRDMDYSSQPIVGSVLYDDIDEWTRGNHLLNPETVDWFDRDYEQHNPTEVRS